MTSKRRTFIKHLGATVAGMTVLPLSASPSADPKQNYLPIKEGKERKAYSVKARRLIKETACIDMLSTFGDDYHKRDGKSLTTLWQSVPASFTHEDYQFVRDAGVTVFGWGNMIPTYDDMLKFMAIQNGIIASNPHYFERIDTKSKLEKLSSSNKIGLLITNQESSHFRSVDDVDLFYGLGQRVSQLTYNGKNRLGYGAFEDSDSGISSFGKQIVRRMNQVGMGVDLSHCGDKTTLGGIEACEGVPALITHASCRALAKGLARAKTDEAIKAMAKTGGVIGIPILRFMISEKEPVYIEHFLNHIDHVAQLVGIEHVGIGSDQALYTEDYGDLQLRKDTLNNAPTKYQCHTNENYLLTIEKLNHPFRIYDIAEGLIKKGYKDEHIKMVLGDNFKRALTQIFKH
ncbi:membrane dipeptidase [Zobellia uliginosa]|uniref:Membrane dipeptidase n=1 Tax=Zobellia uliginosa TaxID=143224 RepID=A0ABY1KSP0_9FLAO|nr:membrane dipeptidase [Zobellia uliginosa]SIS72170.1 membrane dipeptidase [Zobellia uliginosa]